jgi:hypothetical protein
MNECAAAAFFFSWDEQRIRMQSDGKQQGIYQLGPPSATFSFPGLNSASSWATRPHQAGGPSDQPQYNGLRKSPSPGSRCHAAYQRVVVGATERRLVAS